MRRVIILLLLLCLFSGCVGLGPVQENKGIVQDTVSLYSAPAPQAVESSAGLMREAPVKAEISPTDQKIIRTADITLETRDVRSVVSTIGDLASRYQGLLQSSSVSAKNRDQYTGSITIRVPESSFDRAIADIHTLGTVVKENVKGEDVTEEYVDITAQRSALQNQLLQYNRIMEKAENVSEILDVQREIERVQVDLDRTEGKIRYLENRISLATISVSIREPDTISPAGQSIPSVVSEAVDGFLGTVTWLVIAIFTLLPVILLAVVLFLIYRWQRRRREGGDREN